MGPNSRSFSPNLTGETPPSAHPHLCYRACGPACQFGVRMHAWICMDARRSNTMHAAICHACGIRAHACEHVAPAPVGLKIPAGAHVKAGLGKCDRHMQKYIQFSMHQQPFNNIIHIEDSCAHGGSILRVFAKFTCSEYVWKTECIHKISSARQGISLQLAAVCTAY